MRFVIVIALFAFAISDAHANKHVHALKLKAIAEEQQVVPPPIKQGISLNQLIPGRYYTKVGEDDYILYPMYQSSGSTFQGGGTTCTTNAAGVTTCRPSR